MINLARLQEAIQGPSPLVIVSQDWLRLVEAELRLGRAAKAMLDAQEQIHEACATIAAGCPA